MNQPSILPPSPLFFDDDNSPGFIELSLLDKGLKSSNRSSKHLFKEIENIKVRLASIELVVFGPGRIEDCR